VVAVAELPEERRFGEPEPEGKDMMEGPVRLIARVMPEVVVEPVEPEHLLLKMLPVV
jgi:hypothetical protein